MKIAVSGASGHIGTAICRRLIGEGHEVRVLIHRDERGVTGLPLDKIQGDVLDAEILDQLLMGADIMVHLAGLISIGTESEKDLEKVNVQGTAEILEACRRNGVRRLVHFSSVHAFKVPADGMVFDESAELAGPGDLPYSKTKAKAHRMVMQAAGLETIVLCPSSVLGPWDFKPSLQGKMLLDFVKGRIPILPPGGFDWVDNRDIAAAVSGALEKGKPGSAYLLTGTYLSVQELARMVGEIAGVRIPGTVAPMWLLQLTLPFLQIYSYLRREPPLYTREALKHLKEGHAQMSSAKAERELGYHRRPVKESIQDSLDWLLTQN